MSQSNSTSKTFAAAKQSVVIRPLSTNQQGFIYHDFSDLKNLVKFVGSKPQIDEEGSLWFRKQQIPDESLILRNTYGQVTDVIPLDKAGDTYEIVADSEFKPEHANKVVAKVKTINGEKGMSRQALKDALTAKKIEFKSGLTRDELQELYDKSVKK